jgi:pyridinium-3,5-bisthiocarboxylic acid mononucleotide nickel chelatase
MRIAYLDCFSGISGDMFLGALVDAGVPATLLEETVRALAIDVQVEISRVTRAGISATKVDVIVDGEKDMPREQWQAQRLEQELAHQHEHRYEPQTGGPHAGEDGGATRAEVDAHAHQQHSHADHADAHAHGRSLRDIRGLIQCAAINDSGKQLAIRIFENLGAAEAKIHNCAIEEVHFHEVGAEDAIVDIVGAAVGSEALQVDEWICSPLNVGSGTVQCAHGVLPVPAPATLELLNGAPIYASAIQKELVTPTGAAIVKTLVSRFAEFPRVTPEKIGYGAGFRDLHDQPNVLRLTVGTDARDRVEAKYFETDTVTVLEANLDDMNPQIVGHVFDRLFDSGALDAFCTPVQMKKGRPGLVLTVLSRADDVEKLARIIFAETTTIGLRTHETNRLVLPRRQVEIATPWGTVRMKVANLNGTVANYAPEYEDCRRLATTHNVPLKAVMQEAIRLYLQAPDRKQNG